MPDYSYQPIGYSGYAPPPPTGGAVVYGGGPSSFREFFQGLGYRGDWPKPSQDTTGMATVNQANALGTEEASLLNRQAPTLQVDASGLQAARANQQAGIQAAQQQLNGPSLAGLQANQAMGQARQQMGGASASNPLAMRQAMLGGNQQLGQMAQQGGGAVGQEYAGRLGGLGSAVGAMGQGDVASQNAMQQLAQSQQKLYLGQRQQNLTAAQGNEQNYWNVMSAQQRAALQASQTQQQIQQAQNTQNMMIGGASASAAAALAAAAITAGAAAA